MKGKHTPPPWIAIDWDFERRWLVQADRRRGSQNFGRIIVNLQNPAGQDAGEEEAANAHLIAAAPDLLACCESVAEALRGPLPVDPANIVGLLEGVIARAEGA